MSDRVHVLAERRLEDIHKQAQSMYAQARAIDTIQMLSCEHVRGRPGLPAQLRGCTARLNKQAARVLRAWVQEAR
jgi:predicted ATP-dependent serine protease